MSASDSFDVPRPQVRYVGQRAEGHATQIVGNVGTFYSSSERADVEECLAALFLTDPRDDRSNLIHKKGDRVGGTCQWIKEDESYTSWFQSWSELLWVSGGPGKGKTMLSIFLAQELEWVARNENAVFMQYFCDNKDERLNTAVGVLRGLIYQLVQQRPEFIRHILPTFAVQRGDLFTDSLFGSLWTCFETMVRDPSLRDIYCVVDGLDECNEASLEVLSKGFRSLFRPSAVAVSPCHLHFIVVSRESPDCVSRELSGFPHIRLDPDAQSYVNSDIQKFITKKVDELSLAGNYTPELRSCVEAVFRWRAEGTFLWVGLVAKELEKYTHDEVKVALDRFPRGLDELYARMLLHIPARRRTITAKILRWIVMAVRPLTLSELSAAIGTTADFSRGVSCEHVTMTQVSNCGYLLTLTTDQHETRVNLIHQSAKDYLLRKVPDPSPELEIFRIDEETADSEIALECQNYYQKAIPIGGCTEYGYVEAHRAFPLLKYAAYHWPDHARRVSDPESGIFDLSLPFYRNKLVLESWLRPCENIYQFDDMPYSNSLFHVISYLGLVALAKKLLHNKRWKYRLKRILSIKSRHGTGTTPLHLAVQSGHREMVQLLLKEGADLRGRDYMERTALDIAVQWRNEALTRLLVEEGADIMAYDRRGETALHKAASEGSAAVVELLLEMGADVRAKDRWGKTALHAAASAHSSVVVRLLLENGADLRAEDREGETALHDTISRGFDPWEKGAAVVRLLYEKGADLEARDARGRTALCRAVLHAAVDEDIVWLLLDYGADPRAEDRLGRSVLHALVRSEHKGDAVLDIMELLFDYGADPRAEDYRGRSVLYEAVRWHADEEVIQLLLDEGADPNVEDLNGNTALRYAEKRGDKTVIRLLRRVGGWCHVR
ncbi:hypothetical protein H2201_004847 [Coniosporium apollinis]|uniref:NACHT domain-containing protein n=1 Tax=Coniosporium apollinis TaxID=61459 RepID=A0ABQ9NTF6_9PEZI|nr:hypothetical protein H2201_004847 [Coniosporium apollinis]